MGPASVVLAKFMVASVAPASVLLGGLEHALAGLGDAELGREEIVLDSGENLRHLLS